MSSVEYRPGQLDGVRRSAAVTYRLGGRVWTQAFDAVDVDDAELGRLADASGLRFTRTLDEDGTWVELVPKSPSV